jgi:receptor-binding and translocation channel-forming TcA subunit of Tc toxin/ABC toxin-like protein/neuraminidase-like protein/putative peptidoglycan binding protein
MNKITFPLKPQMTSAEVVDLHQALALLGLEISDMENGARRYGPTTRMAVRKLQLDHQLSATGIVDEATANLLNRLLVERGVLNGPAPGTGDVPTPGANRNAHGTVRHFDGSPISGLRVRLFNRLVGGEERLNESTTNNQGQYSISYPPPPGMTSVDLFARAYDSEDAVIGVSIIMIGAGQQEQLDLTIDDDRFRGPSEFARTTAALTPLIAGSDLNALDADDIALLVRKAATPRVNVTSWIASKRIAERRNLSHEAMYGLIRIENTALLPRLLKRSRPRLRNAIIRAANENLISREVGDRAVEITGRLKQTAASLSASVETPGSLGRLLATGQRASAAQQRIFIDRYARHDGPVRELWRGLRKDPAFGNAAVDDLQLSLQLGALTANHPPLVQALRSRGITRSSETASLTRGDWQALLRKEVNGQPVGAPANIKGDTEAERLNNYTSLLTERAALAFPTATVANALKTTSGWENSTSVSFFESNPQFNIKSANIKATLASPGVVIKPEWDMGKLESDLSALQRVTRIAPVGKEASVASGLLTKGYSSAFSVSRRSLASFTGQTAALVGGEATAKQVYANAQRQVGRALGAFGLMNPATADPLFNAIGEISENISTDATWASLFGAIDYCRCDHCRSIYSPAAYFVDLLAWLDGHQAEAGVTVFDLLDKRRPDLKRIQLSCENTNTALPYVDLVNEILEDRVLNPLGADIPQGNTAISQELLANPEFLRPEVYDDHLSQAVYPDKLPFDLWHELAGIYLTHLGVNRADLMEAMQRDNTPSDDSIAAARLGLSGGQWDILAGLDSHSVWEYWGYSSAVSGGVNFKTDLAIVSNFLDRARIEYDDLLDLLHSRFANPNGVAITGDDCNTDNMTLTPLAKNDPVRMNQFLRLWRNRGWTMLDLDKALHALGVSSLNPAGLRRLANLDRIQELTKAPLLDILSWWSPIDTFEDRVEKDEPVKSLYERVFLNRAVDAEAGEEDFPFALNDARDGLRNIVSWDEVRSQLQAALGVNADEVSLLIDETVDGLPNLQRVVTGTTVTLNDLSALYRHVSLARAMKAPLEPFLGLLRLIGIDPFDVDRTAATVDFVEMVAEVRASDFSQDDLHYLLEHDADAETRVGVTDETIGQTLVEIRDGLARIETEFSVASDPTGVITSGYLAVLLDPESLAEVMTALQTPEAEDGSNNADLANTLTDKLGAFFSFDAAALIHKPVERRFTGLLVLLAPYLQETQGAALIIQKIGTYSGRGLDSVEDLVSLRVKMTVAAAKVDALRGLRTSPYVATTNTEIVGADDAEAFSTLRRIHKAALALNKLEVDIDEQVWLFDVGTRNGLLNPVNLPTVAQTIAAGTWDEWVSLVDLFGLRKALPGGEPSLVELLRLIDPAEDAIAIEDAFRSELASRTGWLREDVDTLIEAFGFQFPQDWRDGQALWTLVDAFTLIRRTGVSAAQADGWVMSDIGATQAEEIRLAAKSKHDETRWLSIARALRDPVREKQRAALVAYLIAQNEDYADEEDLYSDLLIDVEMSPCMLTSRIKQAISSVQLFIQRSFLNLEEGVALTREDRDQWEWMKNYRVWEAARKVFLYPENWIEPELRDAKSQLFERLENSLLQGELTDESAEKAYMEYLEGLLRVARLEVMGMYHQFEEDEDGVVNILHVVARTQGHPREYYYRQWIDEREWTPWEKIDADIEADHIILAVHDRRLYLFWPMVVQKAEGDGDTTSNFLEMKLAWVERFHEQWGARKLSTDSLKVNGMWDQLDLFSHVISGPPSAGEWLTYFRLVDNDPLTIECRQAFSASLGANILGRFVMDSCTGAMFVDNTQSDGAEIVAPSMSIVQRMRFFLTSGFEEVGTQTPFTLMSGAFNTFGHLTGEAEEVEVLGKVPAQGIGTDNDERDGRFAAGTFGNYVYPHQYDEFASQRGVFLDDDQRTFHVKPETRIDWESVFEDDAFDPVIVGATESKNDVFTTLPKDEPFEPEFDWDKTTEPPIVAEKQTLALSARPVKAMAILNIGGSAGQAPISAERLTDATLQASQTQLNESNVDQDPFTSVMTTTDYRFSLFYHPYVCDFLREVRRLGVEGLLDPNPDGPASDLVRQKKQLVFFAGAYDPTSRALEPYPIQKIDFDVTGAYSLYNWEVFFHAPLLIANRLFQDQRFEEARRWLHFVFDPTSRSPEPDSLRFWKIQPFYRPADAPIGEFLELAASTDDSSEVEAAREQYDQQVNAWLVDPFNPHAIARLRTTAYQKSVVMKYLDNLIGWGDNLFRRDTIETINEATQLYVLALELLGERPDILPPRSEPDVKTFEEVRHILDGSVLNDPVPQSTAARVTTSPGNPIVDLENILFDTTIPGSSISRGLGAALLQPAFYFCIPPNEKLLGYWDLVEDRLFKIRHCMNIEGVVRRLPLFEPPIDPGMLVRARAAGVDLASALADLNAPLPHYRFSVMLQKAYSLNQTVRSLGASLLSALEKRDAEELSRLRANQEVALLEAVRQVKKLAIEEARHSLAAAERSLEVVQQRRDYYQNLTGDGWLVEEKAQVGGYITAGGLQFAASILSLIGAAVTPIPRVTTGASGTMGTPVATADVVDGAKLGKAFSLAGQSSALLGAAASSAASVLGITSGFKRRDEEWKNQLELSKREIKQIEKQIEAGQVRLALAERDLENHERQIENARSVREFMENKFTNTELYQWMIGQLSSLYFQSYQLSYDLAKKAEQAYRHELALPDSTFIQFGYWDSLKKGLLAGERLQYDLERMDAAYLENNRREYEITKHISLASLDPVALLNLTTEGYCEFSIPESLFDIDYPGHYLRRIKSVSVTIPCVSGPYTNAPCRLTLVSSRTRIDPSAAADYPFDAAGDDSRFQIHTGAVESIVISGGRDDAGIFAPDTRDERYLPFEGAGAISDWSLKMTSAVPTFDWSTITDVVLSMRYTAREGGEALEEKAIDSLSAALAGIPLRRAFSAKREFPTEWNAFLFPATGATEAVLKVELSENRFPYLTRDAGLSIRELQLVALVNDPADWTPTDVEVITGNRQESAVLVSTESEFAGHPNAMVVYGNAEPGAWTVIIPTTSLGAPSEWIEDLALVVTYEIDLNG